MNETGTKRISGRTNSLVSGLEMPNANLVAGMGWFLSTYTLRFNHRHKLFGHVLSGIMGFMPRTMRVEYPGAIYHVMDRGDRREDVFVDDIDRQDFLKTLAEACRKTDWQVHWPNGSGTRPSCPSSGLPPGCKSALPKVPSECYIVGRMRKTKPRPVPSHARSSNYYLRFTPCDDPAT